MNNSAGREAGICFLFHGKRLSGVFTEYFPLIKLLL
jgi:hypothetical protein